MGLTTGSVTTTDPAADAAGSVVTVSIRFTAAA